jgi:hypothetical protein
VSGFHQLDVQGSTVHYRKPRNEQKGEAPLEPNHTKFIFVDDGSERKYGREITFRARLEKAISGDYFASKPVSHTDNQYASLSATAPIKHEQSGTLITADGQCICYDVSFVCHRTCLLKILFLLCFW